MPASLYFTALSSRLNKADTSWRRSPIVVIVAADVLRLEQDAVLLGARADALHRFRHDVADVDDLVLERLVDLDAGQLEQVVDRAADSQRFGEDALGQAAHDVGILFAEQRSRRAG